MLSLDFPGLSSLTVTFHTKSGNCSNIYIYFFGFGFILNDIIYRVVYNDSSLKVQSRLKLVKLERGSLTS